MCWLCEAEVDSLAIMQDHRNNDKQRLKMVASWPFWILFLRNLSWVILA